MASLDVVKSIRAKYPTPLAVKHARFLNEVCLALGAKMFKKESGAFVTLPNGVKVSQDIIILANEWIDILGDAEGAGTPMWSPNPSPTGTFVDPLPMSAFDPVVDPPGPPPPPEEDTSLKAIVAALITQVKSDEASLLKLSAEVAELTNKVAALSARKYVVEGSTNKVFSHAHQIKLEVKHD